MWRHIIDASHLETLTALKQWRSPNISFCTCVLTQRLLEVLSSDFFTPSVVTAGVATLPQCFHVSLCIVLLHSSLRSLSGPSCETEEANILILTNSTEQSLSWEAKIGPVSQRILLLLWNINTIFVFIRVSKWCLSYVGWFKSILPHSTYSFQINFNIVIPTAITSFNWSPLSQCRR